MSRRLPALVAALVAAVVVTLTTGTAYAEDPPVNPADDQIAAAAAEQNTRAAEVGRISGLIITSESEMERLGAEVDNAASAAFTAQSELDAAEAAQQDTAAAAVAANADLAEANTRLASFARSSYIQGSTLDSNVFLLDSDGPAEMIERAGLLEAISGSQLDVVSALEVARVSKANADSASRQAVLERAAAEDAAAAALDLAETTLATSRAQLAEQQAQQLLYQQQLQDAQVALLGLEGARVAYEQYQARLAAEAAELARQAELQAAVAAQAEASSRAGAAPVASGGWVKPAAGPITSCYCARWGTFHYGIDIGAPMYAPIYAVGDGTVVRAGPATGFGQAIYIEHSNGDTTVYGHEEVILVSAGQRVYAGQLIAKVGMRGFSTGPHLHFEVHRGSTYGPPTDPISWLAARGVYY